MIEERIILQVLAEQRDEILRYNPSEWVSRQEESMFEFDSTMAQVVIGVRRSGKSTLCHKVLLEHGIRYGYVNLDDDRLRRMMADLERESAGLKAALAELSVVSPAREVEENYRRFFALAREYTQIPELNRDILLTFVEKIEVGPKEYPDGTLKATHRNQPYRQSIRIFYKFIGEMQEDAIRALPVDVSILKQSENLDNVPNSA